VTKAVRDDDHREQLDHRHLLDHPELLRFIDEFWPQLGRAPDGGRPPPRPVPPDQAACASIGAMADSNPRSAMIARVCRMATLLRALGALGPCRTEAKAQRLCGSNGGSVKHWARALGVRDESVNGQDMQGLHRTRNSPAILPESVGVAND